MKFVNEKYFPWIFWMKNIFYEIFFLWNFFSMRFFFYHYGMFSTIMDIFLPPPKKFCHFNFYEFFFLQNVKCQFSDLNVFWHSHRNDWVYWRVVRTIWDSCTGARHELRSHQHRPGPRAGGARGQHVLCRGRAGPHGQVQGSRGGQIQGPQEVVHLQATDCLKYSSLNNM